MDGQGPSQGQGSAILSYGQIFLGTRGAVSQGQLKVSSNGLLWKRTGGSGKVVEIKKADIASIFWTRVTRGCQLGVRVKEGATHNFVGFRERDLEQLQNFSKQQYGMEIKEMMMSTSGRNWGGVAINGKSLMFIVDGRPAFEVPLPDVVSAQQAKDDVMMEFNVDDTAADEREDMLAEMAFHVPQGHEDLAPENPEDAPAKVLLDQVLAHTDTGGVSGDEAVARFSDVHVLAPRGRFDVDMFHGHVNLAGQTQDFKIRFASIQRIFILPKSSTPHTLVVVSLDPPIRKGQTYYTHILCQFPSEEEVSIDLDITPEALAAKNEKCGGKLEASMTGPVFEVFARTLRGLSGAKITRPGAFKNAAQDGFAVRCSYKADDGYLYPLDRAFFYIQKPPMLIPFDEVESVELTRLGGNAVSSKTFDLVVRTKNDVEHQFRSIQRNEWQVLLDFFQAKRLRVERLREAQAGPNVANARAAAALDDDDDAGMRHAEQGVDEDEDDEDFVGGDKSSSSGGSDNESGDDSGDAEMIEEEGIKVNSVLDKKKGKKRQQEEEEEDEGGESEEEEKPKKAKKPAAAPKKEPKSKEAPNKGGDTKKPRKKKDPNAPKKNMTSYMHFSNAMRSKMKAENPSASFGELAKLISERWKTISPEEKAPYEEAAKQDKQRYNEAMAAYKSARGGAGGDDDEDGGDEEGNE
ncbi:FACT complex subunit SSRP1-A [Dunaliella salina]|uniref:FACT complex subunit SSRP1 n=1 Tax=Dunaliella salina TaxID=3046 RepID=A0ABQ7GDV5_DUNSA|nr:FACT complex subunit SSRP1-A [Dunaliella salina]|eukprot:KAF5832780.1 FACT complex subunit SSRP1-A [Dunaliella salina]